MGVIVANVTYSDIIFSLLSTIFRKGLYMFWLKTFTEWFAVDKLIMRTGLQLFFEWDSALSKFLTSKWIIYYQTLSWGREGLRANFLIDSTEINFV